MDLNPAVGVHRSVCVRALPLPCQVHFTGFFLPWHRYFVKHFENSLRDKCGYNGTTPYWDWTLGTFSSTFLKFSPFLFIPYKIPWIRRILQCSTATRRADWVVGVILTTISKSQKEGSGTSSGCTQALTASEGVSPLSPLQKYPTRSPTIL